MQYLDPECLRVSKGEEFVFGGERYLLVTQAGEHEGGQILFQIFEDQLELIRRDTIIDLDAIFGRPLQEAFRAKCSVSSNKDHKTLYDFQLTQVDKFSSKKGPQGYRR